MDNEPAAKGKEKKTSYIAQDGVESRRIAEKLKLENACETEYDRMQELCAALCLTEGNFNKDVYPQTIQTSWCTIPFYARMRAVYINQLSRTGPLTHEGTRKILCTGTFTLSSFYSQMLLRTDAFYRQ